MKIMVDSEYLDKLQKSLGVDAEGNATIGKDLEVDGGLQINDWGTGICLGSPETPGVNIYAGGSGDSLSFDVKGGTDCFTMGEDWSTGNEVIRSGDLKTLFGNQSIVGSGNIDLYRHRISVSGDGYEAYFDYISSNSLVCDSVTDLKTLMVGTSQSEIERIPTTLVHNVSGTIETIPGYVGVTSFFAVFSKKAPSPVNKIADITSVSDAVTTI